MTLWKSKTAPPQEVVKVSWNNRNKSWKSPQIHQHLRLIKTPKEVMIHTKIREAIMSSDQNRIIWILLFKYEQLKISKGGTGASSSISLFAVSRPFTCKSFLVIRYLAKKRDQKRYILFVVITLCLHGNASWVQKLSDMVLKAFVSQLLVNHTKGAFINKHILFIIEKWKPQNNSPNV